MKSLIHPDYSVNSIDYGDFGYISEDGGNTNFTSKDDIFHSTINLRMKRR